MCICTPEIRTPYCGRGNCVQPKPLTILEQLAMDQEPLGAEFEAALMANLDYLYDDDTTRVPLQSQFRWYQVENKVTPDQIKEIREKTGYGTVRAKDIAINRVGPTLQYFHNNKWVDVPLVIEYRDPPITGSLY